MSKPKIVTTALDVKVKKNKVKPIQIEECDDDWESWCNLGRQILRYGPYVTLGDGYGYGSKRPIYSEVEFQDCGFSSSLTADAGLQLVNGRVYEDYEIYETD